MRELGFIDEAAAEAASHEVVSARAHRALADVEAPYIAEMVRLEIKSRFGDAALNAGYKVYTTIDGRLQTAANRALRIGLIDYTRRHGWRGAANKVELTGSENPEALEALLDEFGSVGMLQPALVISVAEKQAQVFVKGSGMATIEWPGMSWAKRRVNEITLGPEPKSAAEIVQRGDVVYVVHEKEGAPAELAQVPEVESALIALDPNNGAIMSLVGGFDYFEGQGKFNRVTQAKRQPGSGFKPFMYAAALAGNFTPASVILDAPIIMDDPGLEEVWRPENSGGGFGGPTRLREALVRSRNLVSIRLLKEMGVRPVVDYIRNFGFTPEKDFIPNNLTLALGSMQATPLDVATGFAVFANGGFKVDPFYIDRIEGPAGQIVFTAEPHTVCAECAQPIEAVSDAEQRQGHHRERDPRAAEPVAGNRAAHDSGRTRHHTAGFVHDERHHEGRDHARHRPSRAGARSCGSARQDRHHERAPRHLVQRLQRQPGRQRLGGLRRSGAARRNRRRRAHRGAHLGGLHARSPARCAGEAGDHAGRHHRDEGECRHGRQEGRRSGPRVRILPHGHVARRRGLHG